MTPELVLENRHTGERLNLRRTPADPVERLEMTGSLPPGKAAMSVHVHRGQEVGLNVSSGTLHALVDGQTVAVEAGESLTIPPNTPYRLWNEGGVSVAYEACATPALDLDRYLHAYFDVVNAGELNRPPLTYLAQVQMRHQDSQAVRLLWGPFQELLFSGAVVTGSLTGRFRGADWPGSPERCPGIAPVAPEAREPATA